MNLAELRSLASTLGFADPDVAAAVAMAESAGNPRALGDAGTSYGLWQIHVPAHPEYASAPEQLYDPPTNGAAALKISAGGTNWQPWTTFRTGAYLAFMPGGAPSPPAPPAPPMPPTPVQPRPGVPWLSLFFLLYVLTTRRHRRA